MSSYYLNMSLLNIEEYVEGLGFVTEEWADIVGYEGYYKISSFGRVKVLSRKVWCGHRCEQIQEYPEFIKKQSVDSFGYLRTGLTLNGKERKWFVHVLVAKAFVPNKDNKPQVNHKFGDKKDNRYWQIEWNTAKENNKHAYDNGFKKGCVIDHSCNQKLSKEDILYIFNSKEKYIDLCKKFNVSVFPISSIKRGTKYSDITGKVYVKKEKYVNAPYHKGRKKAGEASAIDVGTL